MTVQGLMADTRFDSILITPRFLLLSCSHFRFALIASFFFFFCLIHF